MQLIVFIYDYFFYQVSNILFVDQPTGTGFSYSSDPSDIRHDEIGVSNDLYDFLQVFFLLLFLVLGNLYFKFGLIIFSFLKFVS